MTWVVVFDLDGTLADTKNLTKNRRVPSQVLKKSLPENSISDLLMRNDFQYEIATLLYSGIPVYIITRAPVSYASTLVFLLGIDFEELIPNSDKYPNPESKIQYIIDKNNCSPAEILYIGDTDNDLEVANRLGIRYQKIEDILESSSKGVSYYQNLVKHCEQVGESSSNTSKALKTTSKALKISQDKSDKNMENIFNWIREDSEQGASVEQILGNLQYEDTYPFYDQNMGINELDNVILRPIISPRFISRYQYDTDVDIKMNTLQMINNLGYGPKLIDPPYDLSYISSLNKIEIWANFKYSDKSKWWKYIKDWKITYSGPEPKLHHLEFIALSMSANIYFGDDLPLVIVPIPSSPFSESRPAEASLRLAYRVAELSEVPIENIFVKRNNNIELRDVNYKFSNIKNKKIILLDDQLTSGKHALDCINLLLEYGVTKIRVQTWTSSKFNLKENQNKENEIKRPLASKLISDSNIVNFLKYKEQILYKRKVENRESELVDEPAYLLSIPKAGWTWYCDYHESYGLTDKEHEALWMGGAHMHYFSEQGDDCTMTIKEW
jgi:phosphoglycolate phosphatase-like HAD superfamily hydrolase